MTASELYERSKYFFPPPPSPSPSREIPSRCGVYFFWESGSVIYVGESIDLKKRLRRHEHNRQDRGVSFIECDKSQRRRLESFYIGLLDPVLNSQSTTRCQVVYLSNGRSSLSRKLYRYIKNEPGCSLSDLRRASGWRNSSSLVRLVIERMVEWGLVTESCVRTPGRSKRVYYART